MSFRKLVVFLCFLSYLIGPGTFVLASQGRAYTYFKRGYVGFHSLLKDRRRAKYRSNWYRIRDLFLKAYHEDEKGPWAPRALYYLGRTYYELGLRSHLKRDYEKAVSYFESMVRDFPTHPWCDDAKLYSAKIKLYHLHKRQDAYIDLLYIVQVYPRGDKSKEASRLLKKLDETYLKHITHSSSLSVDRNKRSVKPHLLSSISRKKNRAILEQIRSWSNLEYTRVVLEFNRKVNYKGFLLRSPTNKGAYTRLVLDISHSVISPGLEKKVKRIKGSMLLGIRYAQHNRNVVRVVMELKRIGEYKIFSLEEPFRVVVDIQEKDRRESLLGKQRKTSINKDTRKYSSSLIEQLGLDIKTIMIDPGHGGKDPGAMWGRLKEKDINLKLAKILGRMLVRRGFRVLYTRTKDVFIPLEERTAMANSRGADLFISLHVNAHPNRRVHGIEVYYLNLASSKDAVRVAARENAVSSKKISDLQVILTDLMLSSKIKESSTLASDVLRGILNKVRSYRMDSNGVKEAPFYVLMGAKMPAILIEIGYITNAGDRRRLVSRSYLTSLARGIVKGIIAYRRGIKRFAGL